MKSLLAVSRDNAAGALVDLIDGTLGRDWQQGGFYSNRKPIRLKFDDPDGRAGRTLWDRCGEMI